MSYNKIENKKPLQPFRSTIKIIGKFSHQNKNVSQSSQIYQTIDLGPQSHVYCPQLQAKPENYIPMGKKIYVEANFIAIIDILDNLWFISDLFPTQLNISAMLSRKVKNIFLSENQCIISNKKNPILLNWGAKKIIDVSNFETVRINQKISRNISNYFQSHILENSHKDDKFLYSNIKKIDNSNKLYQLRTQVVNEQELKNFKKSKSEMKMKNSNFNEINQEVYSIVAFPTQENIFMKNKIVGISVGRVHIMCWDSSGNLFSWGNRSIALGYQQLPHEKIITKPKLVRKLNKFVTMAYAATHYSLALSSEGNVYEWGIKEDQNKINEELIFDPKILKFSEKIEKIIILRGRQDQIACLNTKHQLYLWGKKAAKLLPEQVRAEYKLISNDLYEPFLIPHLQSDNVIDFGMGEQFIAILTSNSFSRMMGEEQQAYWNETLIKIRSKLKLSNNVKTQARQTKQNYFHGARNSQQNLTQIAPIKFAISSNQLISNVDKSYRQRNLKKEYFSTLKNQDKYYINLLRDKKNYQLETVPFTSNLLVKRQKQVYSLSSRLQQKTSRQLSKSKNILYQAMRTPTTPGQTTSNAKDCFGVIENKIKSKTNKFSKMLIKGQQKKQNSKEKRELELQMELHKILRSKFSTADGRRKQRIKCKRTNIQSYEARLERVRLKKESIQQNFNEKISKKVEENSIQFRMHRHQLIMQAKIHDKNRNLLKQTLQSFLIKHYLIRMLISPIQEARRIKIEQFAKSLHLSRIEKNLRKIFVKARVNHGIRKLKKLNFIRFAILCHVFKVYIKFRRQKKAKLMRKIIAQQLYKNVLKEKIRFGLSKTHLNTRKLQKFREWLVLTKIQRIKCLKILWKHHLLSVMKISNDADAISLTKSQENCTFQSLYKQKITANPMLKLETFLNKSPIFDLKSQYFQSIIFLFRRDHKIKSEKIMKCTKKKMRIKFSGQGQVPLNTNIHNTNDLLPYSLHYNLVIRPKSMQINIPQNMKRSQKWIQQQKNIFERSLRQILETHEKNLVKTRRKYDIDLAYFIRQKYQTLAEKRWKYILEYNHIKVTPYKNKRLKELYRIFDLIGMQKILNQDCFPEKYLMLDQAVKKRDAPTTPNPYVIFGINEFKQFFKKYYETISIRAKQTRKNFV